MTAVIFVGPSLPPHLRPAGEALWEWRPPVRQGELYRAALARPAAIGVIDGYFETVPTVWHKEILWAMAEGIHVFGAASIGALRAAELDAFGMRGIGRIYEDFRDGVLQDDDEVALLHGPEELDYPPITEAMVNIRATVAAAAAQGIVTRETAARLSDVAKALFYKERHWDAILRAAAVVLPAAALDDFAAWLPSGRTDQKLQDADAMLTAIRAHFVGSPGPFQAQFAVADTAAFRSALARIAG
jgi:hypothetical protein